MEKVGQGFGVHQAMLNGDVEERGGYLVNQSVEGGPDSRIVAADIVLAWPVGWLIGGQTVASGINAEGKQLVEFRMERLDAEGLAGNQIPVEGFQMAQIEDQAMAFGDGAIEERIATDEGEQIVRLATRFGKAQAKSAVRVRYRPCR